MLLVVKWSIETHNENMHQGFFFSFQKSIETPDVFIQNGSCNDFYDVKCVAPNTSSQGPRTPSD